MLLSVPVLSQGLWTVNRTSGSRSQDSLTSTFMSGMLKTSANILPLNSVQFTLTVTVQPKIIFLPIITCYKCNGYVVIYKHKEHTY